jgi:hypothetical protein
MHAHPYTEKLSFIYVVIDWRNGTVPINGMQNYSKIATILN